MQTAAVSYVQWGFPTQAGLPGQHSWDSHTAGKDELDYIKCPPSLFPHEDALTG